MSDTTPKRPGFISIGENLWQRLPEDHPESLGNLAMAKHLRERQEASDPSDEAILANNVAPEELARISGIADEPVEEAPAKKSKAKR